MKLDETSIEIVTNISNTLEKEGITISTQEITDIVESQFNVAKLAFKKGLEIRLPLFGTFIRKHGVEKNAAAAKFNKLKSTMDAETIERKTLENKLYNKEVTKKRKAEMTRVTFKQLVETPDLVGVKNRYDKVL